MGISRSLAMKYFAYGSNMSLQRLRARVSGAHFVAVARLAEHSLRFHKEGSDNSAKCDAFYTGDDSDVLWGVLFEMPDEQQAALDRAEGLGVGYNAKQVDVISTAQVSYNAMTYYAVQLDANLSPYDWYLNHVLTGARETNLPKDYIAKIESIDSIPDPDISRAKHEYAVHSPQV